MGTGVPAPTKPLNQDTAQCVTVGCRQERGELSQAPTAHGDVVVSPQQLGFIEDEDIPVQTDTEHPARTQSCWGDE